MSRTVRPKAEKERIDYNREVCISNAKRLQLAQNQEDYDVRSQASNIFGLLQECHRLADSIKFAESASEETTSLRRKTAPYPKQIRMWNNFPQIGDNTWDWLTEDGSLQYWHVFPPPLDFDVALQGMHPISSAEDVHNFRHNTAHRYMHHIWRAVLADDKLRVRCLKSLPNNLVDNTCFPVSKLDFRLEPGSDHSLVCLVVGRQRFPLFVVQYVAPQHLSLDQIDEGIEDFEDNYRVRITGGEVKSPFLAALIRAFGHMVRDGVWRGIVDTGEALIFLKVTKKSPQVLKIYSHITLDEDSDQDRYDIRHTVVSEYTALALTALEDTAPSQQWWRKAARLDTCRVNALSITRRLSPLNFHPTGRLNQVIDKLPVIRQYENKRFCTSKCLSGLLLGGLLDPKCPNKDHHGDRHHDLTTLELIEAFRAQLQSPTPSTELVPLHIRGRNHYYLRGTLDGYGYTFLVKVVEKGYEEALTDEFAFYRELLSMQGAYIPVCVGFLDLMANGGTSLIYHGKEIEKMLILSWEGVPVSQVFNPSDLPSLDQHRTRIRLQLEARGMQEGPNQPWRDFVWNAQRQSLVLVNFF